MLNALVLVMPFVRTVCIFLTAVIGGQLNVSNGVFIICAFLTVVIGGQVSALVMVAWCALAMMLTWERQFLYVPIGVFFRGTLVM